MRKTPEAPASSPTSGQVDKIRKSGDPIDGFRRRFYFLFLGTLAVSTGVLWHYLADSELGVSRYALLVVSVASLAGLVVLWRRPSALVTIERTLYWLTFPMLLAGFVLELGRVETDAARQVAVLGFTVWTPALAVWSFMAFGSRKGLFATLGFLGAAGAIVSVHMLSGPPVEASRLPVLFQLIASGALFLLMLFTFARLLEGQNRARAAAEAEAAQAFVDPLTGLLNRRGLEERFEQARAIVERSGESLALYFVDVDDFKRINDDFGHVGGDVMLRQFGQRLRQAVRKGDLVARVGGDEFIVLAIVQDPAHAQLLAEKLVSIYAVPFELDGREVTLHASFGLSVYPQDGEEAAMLMSRADAAMYQAKADGKNGWVAASRTGPTPLITTPS